MPPHQPVPITATSTCSTLVSPLLRSNSGECGLVQPIPGARKDHFRARAVNRGAAEAGGSGSIRPHAALFDYLGPSGGLRIQIGPEIIRRWAGDGDRAALAHARLDF